jgi:hypothetical protein
MYFGIQLFHCKWQMYAVNVSFLVHPFGVPHTLPHLPNASCQYAKNRIVNTGNLLLHACSSLSLSYHISILRDYNSIVSKFCHNFLYVSNDIPRLILINLHRHTCQERQSLVILKFDRLVSRYLNISDEHHIEMVNTAIRWVQDKSIRTSRDKHL